MNTETEKTKSISFSFGNPSHYQLYTGFWREAKKIPGYDAEIQLVDTQKYWTKENMRIVGIDAHIIEVIHLPGFNGGIYNIRLAIN